MMFYLLSLITGVLECGWIAFGVVNSMPLWQILCYSLSYHIGNLFPKPFSLDRRCLGVMSMISFFAGSVTSFDIIPDNAEFVLTCGSLFLLSAVIQSVRSGMKSDGNRLMKRIFRVGGFALAPLAVVIPSVILLVTSVIALYVLKGYNGGRQLVRLTGQKGFSVVMVFHQLHYFFYAHITLTTMSLLFINDYSAYGTVLGALLFCGTWVTYMSVEPLVSRLTDKTRPVFYAGHIGISLLLLSMGFITDRLLFIVLWQVTGFGGGVVYTISAIAKKSGCYVKDSMTVSENIGHTLGLLTAVGIAAVFGGLSPKIMLIAGSVSAALAVVSMMFILRKENCHESILDKG